MKNNLSKKYKIGIIGIGYVGLPLLKEFAKTFSTIGYDINIKKINSIKKNHGSLLNKTNSYVTSKLKDLESCNFYIITVPTPITFKNIPDLRNIKDSCKRLSKILKKNDIVVLESTVYPGVVEDVCVPILSKRLKYNQDFFCGYSPERINVGDKYSNLKIIPKIVAGSNNHALNIIKKIYSSVINKVIPVESIKIAEASKVIENAQRDINIAFFNELTLIFDKLNIDSRKVFKAASTKWNFHNYTPGLVGGHCIGVDPYYLSYVAKSKGVNPRVILSGRNINDRMSKYVFKKIKQNSKLYFNYKRKYNILILGATFKPNVDDIRNSKVFDVIDLLVKNNYNVSVFDTIADVNKNNKYYKFFIKKPKKNNYDIVLIAVSHNLFINLGLNKIREFAKKKYFIFDITFKFKNNKNKFVYFSL